ncbi:MAG: NAD(P)-binding protein, partial [Comamonas sp.]
MRVCVVGAGWGGIAAALNAAESGHRVTLIEAARDVGGRARTLAVTRADGSTLELDNGQHILIGAYGECLRLMRLVGVDPQTALHREPLALSFPDGSGLALPDRAPPWDALTGIARARGWSWREKLALLSRAAHWRMRGFRCAP